MGGVGDGDSGIGCIGVGWFRLEGGGWEVLVLVDAVDTRIELDSCQRRTFFC